jgi:hypothetical protein
LDDEETMQKEDQFLKDALQKLRSGLAEEGVL